MHERRDSFADDDLSIATEVLESGGEDREIGRWQIDVKWLSVNNDG